MLQQLQNKHHPLPAEVACFWCQFCILRLSKKTRQSGICKGNATVLQTTYTHPPNKNRQFFFHIVMHVLYCCSLERWQCVGFWLKEQHILNNKNSDQTWKNKCFLETLVEVGVMGKICYQVTVQRMICLPSRKFASLELPVINTLTIQAMGGCVSLCVCKLWQVKFTDGST